MANANNFVGYNDSYGQRGGKIVQKILFVFIAVVLVAIGYIAQPVYNKYQNGRIAHAGSNFITHLTKEDYETAYNDLVTQNVRDKQTLEEFKKNMSGLKSDNPTIEEQSAIRDHHLGSYYALVSGLPPAEETGKTDGEFNLAMINQDGKWLIDIAVVQ